MMEAVRNDHLQRINTVLNFIENNLNTELRLNTLADVACFSSFHFHRLFNAYVGESTGQYIKRIRVESAATKLCYTQLSITDIAMESGYDTPSAFVKAFRQRFDQAPSGFRQQRQLNPFIRQKLDISKSTNRENAVNVEFQTLTNQKVFYVRKTGPYKKAAEEAWGAIMKFTYSNRLMSKNSQCFGISYDDPHVTEADKLRYDACVTIDEDIEPEGEVGVQTIEGGRYAVFLHKGPYEKFQETYDWIFKTWLPESGKTLRDIPCYEKYLNRDPRRTKPENLRTEIFIPIN